jgi:ornithine cyclodeaminase/alanine dehydrogenase-like protein (mu-crystallin family)
MLVLSRHEVEALLDTERLIDALAQAMVDLTEGTASVPPRVGAMVQERGGMLAAMPAYLPSAGVLESKLVSVFPGNAGTPVPTHQAVLLVFDVQTGSPVAVMDATHITEARTAAGSALATRLLSRPESRVLAILGTGVQARAHARALPRVRPFEQIRVAGRNPDAAQIMAKELSAELGMAVEAASSMRHAMQGADVVCACTHSPEPVVRRADVEAGMHITSIGYNVQGREVDAETVRDAVVVVESRDAALAPPPAGSNDLLWAIRDGMIEPGHVHAEIGELVKGSRPARTSPDQITLYKSMGVGVQDAAAAALVLAAAGDLGLGMDIDI